MKNETTPVIIGAAQFKNSKEASERLAPLKLMEKASQLALKDTGTADIKDFIDAVYVSHMFSWSYRDAPGDLINLLGITPKQKYYMVWGGQIPQRMLNRSAISIAKQEIRASLMTGAEAFYSFNLAKYGDTSLNWPKRRNPRHIEEFEQLEANHFESRHYFGRAPEVYALIETSLRRSLGRSIDQHNQSMGKLLERLSKVASGNPYAWKQDHYSAEEIITPNNDNRIICHPYTKSMIAYHYVDQSAAVIMTNERIATDLGIDKKNWVYPMGGVDLRNIKYISNRPRLYDSPAIREGSRLVLKQAGLTIEDIDAFDIYSCFPCMVEIAQKEIGIPQNDPRELTITGGLPFFGGPLHNYSMHAIVTAVQLIREKPELKIMVTANGGYNSAHSIGIYGKSPPVINWGQIDKNKIQDMIEAESLGEPMEKPEGLMTIDGYTIMYNRKGEHERVLLIGLLENGRRTIAVIEIEQEKIKELEQKDLVGLKCKVSFDLKSGRNFADIIK